MRQAKIKRKNPPPCQLYCKTSELVAGYKANGEAYGTLYATFCLPLDYKVRGVDKSTISMIPLL